MSDSEVSITGYRQNDQSVKAFEESQQLLNFGKWGSEDSSPDIVSFQFGSFETDDSAPSNSWSNNRSGGNDSSSSVPVLSSQAWSNAGGDLGLGGATVSALFSSSQQIKPMEQQSSSEVRFEHKSAPPGLDPQTSVKQASVGVQGGSNSKAQNQMQSQMYTTTNANHFYQTPPGIPLGATARTVPSVNNNQGGIIPQFYPPYDVSSNAQYAAPYNGNVGFSSNISSLNGPTAVPMVQTQQAIPSATQNQISQSGQQQTQQAPQQQQAFAPPPGMTAPYGFYPAPYFPNQAYYYSNQPNIGTYYGQNRNMYQNPRAGYVQPDPYGGNGSLYQPDIYASTGQFAESSSSYGVAPGMPSAGTTTGSGVSSVASNVPGNNNNNNGAKQQNKQNNVLPTTGNGQSDVAYAYNPYASRGSEQQQQQQQHQQQQAWSYPTVGQGWGNGNQSGFSQTSGSGGTVNQQQTGGSFPTSSSQPQHGGTGNNQPPRNRW